MPRGTVESLNSASQTKPVVLVVDDRPTTRSLVRSVLEDAEFRVFEAADGQTALQLIASKKPDLVLLDIIMPEMDGLETLRRIRQTWDEIELPVIMLTVKDTLSDIVTTLEMGATDFLSKPINFPILMARLNRHLHRKRLADQIQQMRDTLEQKVEFRTRQLADQGRELQKSLDNLRVSESRYSNFYNDTPALFITLNEAGIIRSINQFGALRLGWKRDEIIGQSFSALVNPSQQEQMRTFMQKILSGLDTVHGCELLMLNKDGKRMWMQINGRTMRSPDDGGEILLVGEDISETHELADRLAYLSDHDELTGLLNRVELMRRLETQIEQGAEHGYDHVLCLLDIDQFRVINDTRGHVIGDRFLIALARKLVSLLGPSDVVARVGGDEFGLLLTRTNAEAARALAERIRRTIETFRVNFDGDSVGATVSMGLAPVSGGSSNVAEVMTRADAACYRAKQQDGNLVYLFKEDDDGVERHHDEMQWVAQIRQALDADLFELFAQEVLPVNTTNGDRAVLELLLRLRKGDGSLVPNADLMSTVEDFHLANRVDTWVLSNAFQFLADHVLVENFPYDIALNLSGQSLSQPGLLNHVLELFRRYPVPPEIICFEVTESAAISNFDCAREFFTSVRALGCRVALDDFGSGLSSYSYLKQIPADVLKIDGDLISGIADDEVKYAIVESIVSLGHKLGKRIVAEHVETEDIKSKLLDLGVDYLQGHLIGVAKTLESFTKSN